MVRCLRPRFFVMWRDCGRTTILEAARVLDHRDRPGLIGAVGTIAGKYDVNISFMELGRLEPRGPAVMVLALDEPLNEAQCQEILALGDVRSVKMVQL